MALGVRERGLEWAERACDSGFRVKDWLERDSNLDSLWGTPRLEALLRTLQRSDASARAPGGVN